MKDRIPVRYHPQNRRTLVMKVTPVGVVVFIPRHLSEYNRIVRAFVDDGLARLGPVRIPQDEVTSPRQIRALVRAWAARVGVTPGRVQLRDMYRKWGSCSANGNITLNTALCRVPRPLAEYVICHELAHLRAFNHGKAFKALMTDLMPDWRDRKAALDGLIRPEG